MVAKHFPNGIIYAIWKSVFKVPINCLHKCMQANTLSGEQFPGGWGDHL